MTQPCPSQANATMGAQLAHKSHWEKRKRRHDSPYLSRFTKCSYCGSVQPEELLAAMRRGDEVMIEGTTKSYKCYVVSPNLIAGQRARLSSESGPVFRARSDDWLERLFMPHSMPEHLGAPTLRERLRGVYRRHSYSAAPKNCHDKFYFWHFTEMQFEEFRSLLKRRRPMPDAVTLVEQP